MLPAKEQLRILKATAAQIVPEDAMLKKLERGIPLNVKLGVDPTASDLHLGHAVPFRKLRQFQDLGHEVTLIIGDGTAMIGDPSGRNSTRPQLSRDEIDANAQTYVDQAFKVLDPDKTTIRYNSEWIMSLDMEGLLRLMAQFTVARILERDDFHNRYTQGQPISLHEFIYPVMQAYDSVVIKADVEIGGTDQLFNLLAGRELMEKMGMEPQVCLTLPLLVGTDGKLKMSKSYGNYVGVSESANDIFGKVMSIPDELMGMYLRLASSESLEDIERIEASLEDGSLHPNAAKRALARNIAAIYHDEQAAIEAEEHFDTVFKDHGVPEDTPTFEGELELNDQGQVYLAAFLVKLGLANSAGEARRLIDQGGVRIGDAPVPAKQYNIDPEELSNTVMKVGKHKFLRFE